MHSFTVSTLHCFVSRHCAFQSASRCVALLRYCLFGRKNCTVLLLTMIWIRLSLPECRTSHGIHVSHDRSIRREDVVCKGIASRAPINSLNIIVEQQVLTSETTLYISFSASNMWSSTHHKLHHAISSTYYQCQFYLNCIPRLWQFPTSHWSVQFSKCNQWQKLHKFVWSHFESNFNLTDPCTFHFQCPCTNCITL